MYSDEATQSFKNEFSKRLAEVVTARGYPKNNYGRNTALAERLGVTPSYVYKLFNGTIGSPLLLRNLALTLNTTTDYLLGISDIRDRVLDTTGSFDYNPPPTPGSPEVGHGKDQTLMPVDLN